MHIFSLLGANPCIPYAFCYESMGGLDPDFLGWEQSFNCGREPSVYELAFRIGQFSKNKAILYYSASGAFSTNHCPLFQPNGPKTPTTSTSVDTSDIPYCYEEWKPPFKSVWSANQINLEKIKNLYNSYSTAKASANR